MTQAELTLHDDKMRAEIAHLAAQTANLAAQTAKLNKEIRWYEAVIIAGGASAVTLAIVAVTALFI